MGKFFTWITDEWHEPCDVPERVVMCIKRLAEDDFGKENIAEMFNIPLEWVEMFTRKN